MIIPIKGSSGIFKSIKYSSQQRNNIDRPKVSQSQFDQVSISRESSGSEQFQRELTSRLICEVRTTNTSNTIQNIKNEVQNGTYQPNAREIAAKLLLEESICGND